MKYVVIGHRGLSKVVSDVILSNEENEIMGYLDNKYKEIRLIGNTIFAPIQAAKSISENFSDIKFIVAIEDNKIRKSIIDSLELSPHCYVTVIHKSAIVSESAKIGRGNVVMPNVVIDANAQIGDHVIIGAGSIIERDCKIKSFSYVFTGAVLSNGVQLGVGAKIGARAAIASNVRASDWSTVDIGIVVFSDIQSDIAPDNSKSMVKS